MCRGTCPTLATLCGPFAVVSLPCRPTENRASSPVSFEVPRGNALRPTQRTVTMDHNKVILHSDFHMNVASETEASRTNGPATRTSRGLLLPKGVWHIEGEAPFASGTP
jgi:hypothetical protein